MRVAVLRTRYRDGSDIRNGSCFLQPGEWHCAVAVFQRTYRDGSDVGNGLWVLKAEADTVFSIMCGYLRAFE